MNKTAIKNFAVWARRKLISDITYKAGMLGITDSGIAEPLPISTKDLQFFDIGTKDYAEVSGNEIAQRKALVDAIKRKEKTSKTYKEAFEYIVEEVAYTWFNRLIAIRFMEVNDYLPSGVRVLSSENSAKNEPDFVTTPFDTDLEFTPFEQDKVIQLKDENKLDELFRMLFIKECNKLHEILPELFEKTDDYTELLLTISFADKDGVVYHLTHDISENDFNVEKEGQVEIIGWLYQYYNTEPKDTVFANLKKNIKISKDNIPAATQLFTPDWIVRYMVENSLGRIFISEKSSVDSGQMTETERIEKEKKIAAEMGWKYYLPEAEQTPEVRAELNTIHSSLTTELTSLKLIDPCMGSGHILVYAFDVLMQIYESYGYTQRDAARSILTNNIHGLDIDDRAYQLAYFAVMMKARQYNRRILTEDIRPNLFSIQESNEISNDLIAFIADGNSEIKLDLTTVCDELRDAKEYGSILDITQINFERLYNRINEISESFYGDIFGQGYQMETMQIVLPLIKQAQTMAQKYDAVITNPPYMGSNGMNSHLSEYAKNHFPNNKSDLFAMFIEKSFHMTKKFGFSSMITMQSWMFLTTYEPLRNEILKIHNITSCLHLDENVMGIGFGTVASVIRNNRVNSYKGSYANVKMTDLDKTNRIDTLHQIPIKYVDSKRFLSIPNIPIAYWISDSMIKAFEIGESIEKYVDTFQGIITGDNDKFLRLWSEIDYTKLALHKRNMDEIDLSKQYWIPYNKGGEFRKWYGIQDYVVYWRNGPDDKTRGKKNFSNYYLRDYIAWSYTVRNSIATRYYPEGFLWDVRGSGLMDKTEMKYYLQALISSKIGINLFHVNNSTISCQVENILQLPIIFSEEKKALIDEIVINNNINSQNEWDSFETSWDFTTHPLVRCASFSMKEMAEDRDHHITDMNYIEEAFVNWSNECYLRFTQLKENEEELNRIFIDIYGLQDELTPEVEDKDVTVRKADLQREIKSLISYAVGCMLGRYSIYKDGLIYAGGDFSDQWVVVSGQLYLREVVEELVVDELQRINSMAKIYGFGNRSLQSGEASAERGNICPIGSDEESGSVDSVKHCRGTGTKLYEGIRELSFDSKGVESGIGNPTYDLCSPEILDAISSKSGDELVARGWKDADRIDWETIHCTLITNHYCPDADNCLPITDEEYFEDDIVGRFVKFIETVYGKDTLEDNLDFIAQALGNKGNTSREIIRNYFLNDFIKDHIKIYQKRPIYWLYDSGKQNGFKALVYMHRYNADTTGNMRVEYLHRMQRVYEKELERMQEIIDNSRDNKEISVATKRKEKLQKQLKETKEYDAKVAHLALSRIDIDLDDGVKVNYEKVQTASDGTKLDILAKI